MRVMFFSQMDYFKGEVSGHSHRLNCNLGEDNKSKYIVAQKKDKLTATKTDMGPV